MVAVERKVGEAMGWMNAKMNAQSKLHVTQDPVVNAADLICKIQGTHTHTHTHTHTLTPTMIGYILNSGSVVVWVGLQIQDQLNGLLAVLQLIICHIAKNSQTQYFIIYHKHSHDVQSI